MNWLLLLLPDETTGGYQTVASCDTQWYSETGQAMNMNIQLNIKKGKQEMFRQPTDYL